MLTDWIIINSEIQKKATPDERVEYLKTFKDIRGVALYSYLLLETLTSNSVIPDYDFLTSRVAIAELISNIKERHIAEDLFRKLIPLKYLKFFHDYDKDTVFRGTNKDIESFLVLFIGTKKLKLHDGMDLDAIISLILNKNIDTYDSLLIAQAFGSGCDFFVTSDSRLEDNLKNLEKVKIVGSSLIYNKIKDIVDKPTIKL